jgi:hypothetical protein
MQRDCALEVIVQATGGEDARGLVPGAAKDILGIVREVFEDLRVIFEMNGHGVPVCAVKDGARCPQK